MKTYSNPIVELMLLDQNDVISTSLTSKSSDIGVIVDFNSMFEDL